VKICFIADVRSSISRNWIRYFPTRGHEVHVLATSLSEDSTIEGATIHGLVSASKSKAKNGAEKHGLSNTKFRFDPSTLLGRTAFGFRNEILRPVKCILLKRRAQELVKMIHPDLLHALRIPIEGELGGGLGVHPFVTSIWGNDLTLYAANSFIHRALTSRTLKAADGLLADTNIDIQRAHAMVPMGNVPSLRLPGCGGLNSAMFFSGRANGSVIQRLGVDPERPVVLNPRGLRQYVRHDTFFAAIPTVLAIRPDVQFVAVDLKGWQWAEKWIHRSGLSSSVVLTGHLSQTDLAELFRRATVTVSPTEHDGTPNTLLEAMACGCLPICGDLPSVREWITPDVNGILFDVADPESLAHAILRGLSDRRLRIDAAGHNQKMLAENANYDLCMRKAELFYEEVIQQCHR